MKEKTPQVGFIERLLRTLLGAAHDTAVEDPRVGLRFLVRRQLFRNLRFHSRKFPIGQIDEWVQNPVCTAQNCGAEAISLIPAAGTFGVTESCPGCQRKIPLVTGERSVHERYEAHVPLPELKRAVFSALRQLKSAGASFQGTIDVDLMATLEKLAL